MAKFAFKITDERIVTATGLAFAGNILEGSGLRKKLNSMDKTDKRSSHQIADGDIAATFISLACMGKPDFCAVNELIEEPAFYKEALNIKRIAAEETLRQRMDSIGDTRRDAILESNVKLLQKNHVALTPDAHGFVVLDIDVTPQDNTKTKKEGVSRTYKSNVDGFAPIMAYLSKDGYLINTELRAGSQHCQKDTPAFLKETIGIAQQLTDEKLLVRLDSGNDAAENIDILINRGCGFIIKRNLRQEDPEWWFEHLARDCKDIRTPREGKKVYVGSTWKETSYTDGDGKVHSNYVKIVYEIIERTIDKEGQHLLVHDLETNMFWTNTPYSNQEVINSYHAHGESEQYHSEFKTDMGLERLPSGKSATNALVMELGMMAYNILRIIGQQAARMDDSPMRKTAFRRRLRTVIMNLIMAPSHVTIHARKTWVGLGCVNSWRHTIMRLSKIFHLS